MKIYFDPAQHEHIDMFGDEGLYGPDDSGNFYYGQVDIGEGPGGLDDIRISDTCGRMVPVSVDGLPSLIRALTFLQGVQNFVISGERAKTAMEFDFSVFSGPNGLDANEFEIDQLLDAYAR